jgi:hypothetical protein
VGEEPEKMLPEQRIAALRRIEERPAERALQLEQRRGEDDGGKGKHDHRGEHQH